MPKIKNTDILSAGSKIYAKKRKRKQEKVESVDFDFDKRKDFLTGFHKRKVERKKKTQEKYKELARQEKIKMRAETKAERQRLAEHRVNQVAAALRTSMGDSDEDDLDNDSQDDAEDSVPKTTEPKIEEFKSKKALTTVTVIEDLNLDEM